LWTTIDERNKEETKHQHFSRATHRQEEERKKMVRGGSNKEERGKRGRRETDELGTLWSCGLWGAWRGVQKQSKIELLTPEGLRVDGRRPGELRVLDCRMGLFPGMDGSAFFQQGNTRVIATVRGPCEVCHLSFSFSVSSLC